jgi:hypothetical protein
VAELAAAEGGEQPADLTASDFGLVDLDDQQLDKILDTVGFEEN